MRRDSTDLVVQPNATRLPNTFTIVRSTKPSTEFGYRLTIHVHGLPNRSLATPFAIEFPKAGNVPTWLAGWNEELRFC